MKTTILQPTYLPWLGYFEMIDAMDQYVVFDHVQFQAKSWQQRNRIKAPNGPLMLTVPVLSDGTQQVRIADKRVAYNQPWVRKHIKSIRVAYQRAPYFERYFDGICQVLESQPPLLADLTMALNGYFIECLGIQTQVVRSSELLAGTDDSEQGKTEKVVNLCRAAGASVLYDGKVAQDFLQLEQFAAHQIEVIFQDYQHPQYPQLGKEFAPFMCVADLLFNCGDDALQIIRSGAAR